MRNLWNREAIEKQRDLLQRIVTETGSETAEGGLFELNEFMSSQKLDELAFSRKAMIEHYEDLRELAEQGSEFADGQSKFVIDVLNDRYTIFEMQKYVIFSLDPDNMGFVNADGSVGNTDIAESALFTEEQMEFADESEYIHIPLSQDMIDSMPFGFTDIDPNVVSTNEEIDLVTFVDDHPDVDFVVLTQYGFYDEKYNELTNTSRPKVRSTELDYANLYNKEGLKDNEWILKPEEGVTPMLIPISKVQQEALQKSELFSSESEPYGFFFKPIGREFEIEPEPANLEDLSTSLDALQGETNADDVPWEL